MKLSDIRNALAANRKRHDLPADVDQALTAYFRDSDDGVQQHNDFTLIIHKDDSPHSSWFHESATNLDDLFSKFAAWLPANRCNIFGGMCPTCGHAEATP